MRSDVLAVTNIYTNLATGIIIGETILPTTNTTAVIVAVNNAIYISVRHAIAQ